MINPKLSRGEYWLLEAVAELAIPICWLDWDDLEMVLNKRGHGMDRTLLIETLLKLFSNGLITAHRFDHWDETFVFTEKKISAALNEVQDRKKHYYRLTAKGGEYWEAFAYPNWDYYIDVGYELSENENLWIGEISCTNKSHLKKYLNSVCYHDYDIDYNSIQHDILKPWEATYWKELSVGHKIRFECIEKELNDSTNIRGQRWYDINWYQWK